MNRKQRSNLAADTLKIIEQGGYENNLGEWILLQEAMQRAVMNSVAVQPDDFDLLRLQLIEKRSQAQRTTMRIETTGETTLACARRLICEERESNVVALNLASSKNPGGGFLSGSQAQEESLARSSGLYPCLTKHLQEVYEANKQERTPFYTDRMIFSQDVPVFRDDEGSLLESPYLLSIVTSAAVNRGAVMKNRPSEQDRIPAVMRRRVERMLTLVAAHECRTLILGAWGCGVFRNDPAEIAGIFSGQLLENNLFAGMFDRVVFAVLDTTPDQQIIKPFEELSVKPDNDS